MKQKLKIRPRASNALRTAAVVSLIRKKRQASQEHVPTALTRHDVSMMAAYGIPQSGMCHQLGITEPTLLKHYKHELENGLSDANKKVAAKLYQLATTGEPSKVQITAILFWLKTRARYRETNNLELTGRDGNPIEYQNTTALTDEERATRVLQILNASAIGGIGQGVINGQPSMASSPRTTNTSLLK